jgi:hypothetical protein
MSSGTFGKLFSLSVLQSLYLQNYIHRMVSHYIT